MDRAADDHANHQPEESREKSELGGKDRTDQGTGPCDGSEVVTEEDPFAHGVIVLSVEIGMGGGFTAVIESQHLGRDEAGIITVGDRKNTKGADDDGEGVHDYCPK